MALTDCAAFYATHESAVPSRPTPAVSRAATSQPANAAAAVGRRLHCVVRAQGYRCCLVHASTLPAPTSAKQSRRLYPARVSLTHNLTLTFTA